MFSCPVQVVNVVKDFAAEHVVTLAATEILTVFHLGKSGMTYRALPLLLHKSLIHGRVRRVAFSETFVAKRDFINVSVKFDCGKCRCRAHLTIVANPAA